MHWKLNCEATRQESVVPYHETDSMSWSSNLAMLIGLYALHIWLGLSYISAWSLVVHSTIAPQSYSSRLPMPMHALLDRTEQQKKKIGRAASTVATSPINTSSLNPHCVRPLISIFIKKKTIISISETLKHFFSALRNGLNQVFTAESARALC